MVNAGPGPVCVSLQPTLRINTDGRREGGREGGRDGWTDPRTDPLRCVEQGSESIKALYIEVEVVGVGCDDATRGQCDQP